MHDCIWFRSKDWVERQPVIKFHIKPDGKPKGWYDGCEVFIHRESRNTVADGESWHCQLIENLEKPIQYAIPLSKIPSSIEDDSDGPRIAVCSNSGGVGSAKTGARDSVIRKSYSTLQSNLFSWERCCVFASSDGKILVVSPDPSGNTEVKSNTIHVPGLNSLSPFSERCELEYTLKGGDILIALS